MSIDKHRFLVLFSYIGTKYSGVQRQSAREPKSNGEESTDNSVQYHIEQSLETINPKPRQDVKLNVSSRTDSGVHAIENSGTLHLVHPDPQETYCPSHILRTANDYFKLHHHNIKLNKIHLVSPEFHLRKHIKWRSYYYRLAVVKPEIANQASFQPESYLPIDELNRCSLLRTPIHLDLDLMHETAQSFRGTHNFTNFSAFSRSLNYFRPDHYTRTINDFTINQCDLDPLQSIDPTYHNINLYEFTVTSRGFLYRQIRRMVGMTIMVGSGQFPLERFEKLLKFPEKFKWENHFFCAPPDGLYLSKIKYDSKDFLNSPESLYQYANPGPKPSDPPTVSPLHHPSQSSKLDDEIDCEEELIVEPQSENVNDTNDNQQFREF